ncbi:MAG: hypothetical protein AAF637_24230, partial [Pseudomonadota bacterium]
TRVTRPAISIWLLANPPVGNHKLEWAFDGLGNAYGVTFVNLTGIDLSDPVGAKATARVLDGNVDSVPVTVMTTTEGSLVLGGTVARGRDADPFTPGVGVFELTQGETGGSSSRDLGYFTGWSDSEAIGDYIFEAEAASRTRMATAAIELKPSAGGAIGTTSGAGDAEAPSVPTNLVAEATLGPEVDLSWSASIDDVAVVGYRIYRDGSRVASPTVTTHTDAAVDIGTTYGYAVSAFDAAGNESARSNSVSVTTTGDSSPPTVPQNLTATAASDTQVDLEWRPSDDDVGVVAYQIYRDGDLIGSHGDTTYADTDVAAQTRYDYAVSAVDAADNESERSGSVSVTTPAAKPSSSPPSGLVLLGDVAMIDNSTSESTGGSASFVSEGGDDSAIVAIFALLSTGKGLERVTEVTYGGQPMTEVAFSGSVGTLVTRPAISIWLLANPPVGNLELEWSVDGFTNAYSVTFVNLTGVDLSEPVGAKATARVLNGNVDSVPVTVMTTTEGSLILGGTVARGRDADPFTPGVDVFELAQGTTGESKSRDLGFLVGGMDSAAIGDYIFEAEAFAAGRMATAAVEIKAVPLTQ